MSEETAGYHVGKKPHLNDTMRARSYFAAAVCLLQSPSTEDHEMAMELPDKAVALSPDFSEASSCRAKIRNCLRELVDPDNNCGTLYGVLQCKRQKMAEVEYDYW